MSPATRTPLTRSGRGRRQNDSDQPFRSSLSGLNERPSPSPSKRQKRDHAYEPSSTPSTTKKMRSKDMYSFPSNNVIDLTSSPTKSSSGSPLSRKPTNGVRLVNGALTNGSKNLIIKNKKQTTSHDPEQYFEEIWGQLSDAVDVIFSRDETPFSMEQLYRGVENLCRQGKPALLFSKLQTKCGDRLENEVLKPLVASSTSKSGVQLLRDTTEAWTTWRRQMVG